MVNIICTDNMVRFTQFNPQSTYNLSDLNILINNNKKLSSVFCIFKTESNDYDAIKLITRASDHKSYDSYMFDPESKISLPSGKLKLFLFGLFDDNSVLCSDEFEMNLSFENYNLTSKLYAIHQLNSEVANYYNKIVSMTELNIQISKDIKDTLNGGW